MGEVNKRAIDCGKCTSCRYGLWIFITVRRGAQRNNVRQWHIVRCVKLFLKRNNIKTEVVRFFFSGVFFIKMERDYQYIFEKKESVTFSAADYVVFAATLLVSASIGLYYAIKDRKMTDEKEFLLAGRSMQTLPVSLSLLSSFISAITLLGTPAEVYTNNTMYWWISIGFILSAAGTAHIFVPVFYQLEITSVFQVRILMIFHSNLL